MACPRKAMRTSEGAKFVEKSEEWESGPASGCLKLLSLDATLRICGHSSTPGQKAGSLLDVHGHGFKVAR